MTRSFYVANKGSLQDCPPELLSRARELRCETCGAALLANGEQYAPLHGTVDVYCMECAPIHDADVVVQLPHHPDAAAWRRHEARKN